MGALSPMSRRFARLGDGSLLGFIPVPVILLILVAVHVMGAALYSLGTICLCHW
jgi:hypothetical protein